MAARWPDNINFAHVKVNLDFNTLVEDDKEPYCVKIRSFVFLPQRNVPVMSGVNMVANHSSYISLDNIRTMSADTFLQDV